MIYLFFNKWVHNTFYNILSNSLDKFTPFNFLSLFHSCAITAKLVNIYFQLIY